MRVGLVHDMTDFDPWGKEPPPDDDQEHMDAAEEAMDAAAAQARAVQRRAWDMRVTDEARRLLAREERAQRPPPRLINLSDFLAEEDADPVYRIDQLWPTGGRILIPAQFKAGKTTLVANLIRSLVDGEPFLERFPVRQCEHLVLIDDELDERTLRHWLRAQDIVNTGAVDLVPLRGNVASFNILDPEVRLEWSKRIAGAEVTILDCLRPILDALGLDENHEAGRFLVPLDTMMADAGCSEGALVHHMGHSGERSRGDSRLNDWPDAIWKLVRDKDDENPDLDDVTGSRYFSAFGRDVEWPQSELTFNPTTRRLTIGDAAQNRYAAVQKRNAQKADENVLQAIRDHPGINKTGLRKAAIQLGSTHNPDIDAAIERLVETGLIWRQKMGAANLHWPGMEPGVDPDTGNVPDLPNLFETRSGTLPSPEPAYVPFRAGSETTYREDPGVGHASEPAQPRSGTSEAPAKSCPDCDAEIPGHQTRCAQCTIAFVEANRAARS